MGIRFVIVLLCIISALSVQAYEYDPYYNRPATNQQVQADFSEYMENVRTKLRKNWGSPDVLEVGHVRLFFKIDRDGNVIAGELTDLGVALVTDIPTKVSELENDANYMKELIAGDGIVIQGDTISSTGVEVGYDSATRTLIFSAPTNMVTAESSMDEIIVE